jgi:hypothetical protein
VMPHSSTTRGFATVILLSSVLVAAIRAGYYGLRSAIRRAAG